MPPDCSGWWPEGSGHNPGGPASFRGWKEQRGSFTAALRWNVVLVTDVPATLGGRAHSGKQPIGHDCAAQGPALLLPLPASAALHASTTTIAQYDGLARAGTARPGTMCGRWWPPPAQQPIQPTRRLTLQPRNLSGLRLQLVPQPLLLHVCRESGPRRRRQFDWSHRDGVCGWRQAAATPPGARAGAQAGSPDTASVASSGMPWLSV